ncbi:hypothetical protein PAXRUDRAFT_531168 [Paxillus rubicundulus Ve08.2h10]|uniref:Uncharacterized protein n=1 Tax=Paxillus rubicundulus Ve08.2h10 TaxID=930991 RepID=A0A0D0E0B1_9AGAM|nr:hypothetical protein PAXRUDRAFT_531168 [Paxillus rubicundulus Ve08.2h10]
MITASTGLPRRHWRAVTVSLHALSVHTSAKSRFLQEYQGWQKGRMQDGGTGRLIEGTGDDESAWGFRALGMNAVNWANSVNGGTK